MNVRAKFYCSSVTKKVHWERNSDGSTKYVFDAQFHPVTGTTDENKKFYAATPSGQLNLVSILPDAFEPGKEYYLDFSLA